MLTKKQAISIALSLPGAVADCPFSDDPDTTVLRHSETGRWFGIWLHAPRPSLGLPGEGSLGVLNLKIAPEDGFILRDAYRGVLPAYHMNKLHWITVLPENDLPTALLSDLIDGSYRLTAKKKKP